jgi:hypothetical protein
VAEPVTFLLKPAALAQRLQLPGEAFLPPIAFVSLAPDPLSDREEFSQA